MSIKDTKYNKVYDYFDSLNGYQSVLLNPMNQDVSFKKIGSDLKFKIYFMDPLVSLEVSKVDISFESGFSERLLGKVNYQVNGNCVNHEMVHSMTANARQRLELDEIITHVKRSLRPNSINFIMDD